MDTLPLNTSITFSARFTLTDLVYSSGAASLIQDVNGATGLTVTCDVYSPAGALLVGDANATEVSNGLYTYVLASANVLTEGIYVAKFKTTETAVDAQEVVDFALVAGEFVETGTSYTLESTLTSLARMLRLRLNDLDSGNYTTEEIQYAINLAYRETQVQTRCYKTSIDISLVGSTAVYSCGVVFEPISVILGTATLEKTTLGDLNVLSDGWTSTAAGTPTKWAPVGNGQIRLYPVPSAGATLTVHGYGYAVALSAGSDTPTGLTGAFAIQAILDRAEAEARKMRATDSNNVNLYNALMTNWNNWCIKIVDAGGEK